MYKEPKITIVELNNTKRKGNYTRISLKGKPTRYYKINDEPNQIEIAKKHYINRYLTGKGEQQIYRMKKAWKEIEQHKKPKEQSITLKKTIKEINQYIKKIKKQGTIIKQIRKGTKSITIDPTKDINNRTKNRITNTLLNNLVIDKKLLKILSTPQNFDKLKNRLEYQLEGKTANGELNLQASIHGKTLNQALQEAKQATKENEQTQRTSIYKENPYLKNHGWYSQTNIETNQQITKWKLTIIIRKGK